MDAQITEKIVNYFQDKPVKKVYLFGSYARNEETPESDVDILVDVDYTKEPYFTGFEFGGMLEDLKDLLLKDVDLVPEDGLSKFLRPFIEKDKILILQK
ncbi:MAG: nucleotidyltransferase domain-containing protein [Arcicella sp.]|nr:nucleotidyltransferase domain-containing protein [Arcicella sp.]